MRALIDNSGELVGIEGAPPELEARIRQARADGKPVLWGKEFPDEVPEGAIFVKVLP